MCEAFNKMGKFIEYVIFDESWYYRDEIELWEIVLVTIMFLIVFFIISWWLMPIKFIYRRHFNVTFYCKNKKGE